MSNCIDCNLLTCPNQGYSKPACTSFESDGPQYEVYTFNERTGSENVHLFYTQDAADAFMRCQPQHKMAH